MDNNDFFIRYPKQQRAAQIRRQFFNDSDRNHRFRRLPGLRSSGGHLLRTAIILLIASSLLCIACSVVTLLVIRTSPLYIR